MSVLDTTPVEPSGKEVHALAPAGVVYAEEG